MNEDGPSRSDEKDDEGPPRKKRGSYKKYLTDPSLPIPRSTLLSRLHKAQQTETEQAEPPHPIAALQQHLQQEQAEPPHPIAALQHVQQPADNEHQALEPLALENEANQLFTGLHQAEEPILQGNLDQQPDTIDVGVTNEDLQENIDQEAEALPKVKPAINYVDKYQLTDRLHPDFSISRLDTLLMILHLALRHCHTQHFIEDLIKFVNVLFGSTVLDVSYYIFTKLFKPLTKITKHFFCSKCEIKLGVEDDFEKDQKSVKCEKCSKEINIRSVTSGEYFITLPIKPQIEELLRKPNVKIIPRSKRGSSGGVADIFDGACYIKLMGCHLEHFLTVTMNTDGVAVHDSTKNSLWPIFMHVNEICPEERFKTENLILAGLWFGRSAPNMALFMKPVIEELLDLSSNGVDFVTPEGPVVKCPVFPLACSLDSVAKPKVVCQKQFNAYSGCLYCYHPNDSTVEGNNVLRYYDTSKSYSLRTEEEVLSDMMKADKLQRQGQLKDGSVNGFIGISILLLFTKLLELPAKCNPFNIVWGVVIDYLHCVLEGVAADLFGIFDRLLSPEDLKKLDARCKVITPPKAMTRRPRSFTDRSDWKAKEFRAFLLYYALPCLEDLLPKPNFSNLKLFVDAIHILLSDSISLESLAKAKRYLHNFAVGFQRLYGLENVTYNLHLCTHLVDLVQRLGPLWCYSNFIFESGNGLLLNFLRGTKSVIHEIAVKFGTLRSASKFFLNYNISPEAFKFCKSLLEYEPAANTLDVGNVRLTSHSVISLSNLECELLEQKNVSVKDKEVVYYHRAIRNGILYTSKSYTKAKVFDDSCVLLSNGTYATVDKIVKSDTDELLCVIQPIRLATKSGFIKKCAHDFYNNVCVVPFSEIRRKCMLITFESKGFVCHIPNLYERD